MKKRIALLLIILPILTIGFAIICLYSGYDIYSNIAYADKDCNLMDIYLPKKVKSSGCVLFIHGGSWTGGDKSEEAFMCRFLASRGYVSATMNYTLAVKGVYDSYSVDLVLSEIDEALLKLQSFAIENGITIDRAATSGYSAGAHLSMLYAFSRGEKAPIDIKFTANLAGPADICYDVWGEDLTVRIGELLSGRRITNEMLTNGEADGIFKTVSPVTYVNENTPPSLIAYGGKDSLVSRKNGDSLTMAFEKYGVDYDYLFFPLSNHAMITDVGKRLKYTFSVLDYCHKYFV